MNIAALQKAREVFGFTLFALTLALVLCHNLLATFLVSRLPETGWLVSGIFFLLLGFAWLGWLLTHPADRLRGGLFVAQVCFFILTPIFFGGLDLLYHYRLHP